MCQVSAFRNLHSSKGISGLTGRVIFVILLFVDHFQKPYPKLSMFELWIDLEKLLPLHFVFD